MTRKLTRQEWFHSDGFPVAVERREPQGPFEPHSHEFSELVLVTESEEAAELQKIQPQIEREGEASVVKGRQP